MSPSTLLRSGLVRCALVCVAAQSGSAVAHDAESQDIGRIAASPGERWFSAAGISRPAVALRPAAVPKAGDIVTVTAPGPGQGGYVHYFVIDLPDGGREIQVGIELPDGRIAWSFPELGVVVSPFMESGTMQAGGKSYPVRHLYGIRPFRNDVAMIELQKDLWKRVIPWVEDATPYCALAAPSSQPCLSCLGLVLRVLYPSSSGGMPALPRDFQRSGADPYFTTDDLLLYQTGLHGMRTLAERMARINALSAPLKLRDDLVQIAQSLEAADDAESPKSGKTATNKRPPRSVSKAAPLRPSTQKKL